MSEQHDPNPRQGQVRRIVTGHDAQGRSIVSEDGIAPSVHTNPKRVGYCLTELWMHRRDAGLRGQRGRSDLAPGHAGAAAQRHGGAHRRVRT